MGDCPSNNQERLGRDRRLDTTSYIPLYKQIKNRILEDIKNQVYKPDSMIPSQKEFAEKYGVSRVTVRQAITDLTRSGILYSHKGKGTFVRKFPVHYRGFNRLHGFSEDVRKTGQRPAAKLLQLDVVEADKELSESLRVEIGHPLVYLKRLRMAQNLPLTVENVYLNKERVGAIDFRRELRDDVSLYKLLREQAGITLRHAEEMISAVLADEDEANLLGVTVQDPILFIRRVTYEEDGPVEYCENYMRSDVHGIMIRYDEQ